MRIPNPEEMLASRLKLGLSQQQVADFVGVSQRAYSLWESGTNKPKAKSTIKLLEVLKLDSEFSESESSKPEVPGSAGEIAALKKIIAMLESDKARLEAENQKLKQDLEDSRNDLAVYSRRYFSELEPAGANEPSEKREMGTRLCRPALFGSLLKPASNNASWPTH